MERQKKGSGFAVVIIIIIIIVAAWLVFRGSGEEVTGPVIDELEEVTQGEDTTAAIEAELEGIDLGDLDAEFESIDADLNQL